MTIQLGQSLNLRPMLFLLQLILIFDSFPFTSPWRVSLIFNFYYCSSFESIRMKWYCRDQIGQRKKWEKYNFKDPYGHSCHIIIYVSYAILGKPLHVMDNSM